MLQSVNECFNLVLSSNSAKIVLLSFLHIFKKILGKVLAVKMSLKYKKPEHMESHQPKGKTKRNASLASETRQNAAAPAKETRATNPRPELLVKK